VGFNREIRWTATIQIMSFVRYQSYPIDRLVLFVIRVFDWGVVGDLDRIKRDDHEREASPGRGVREDGWCALYNAITNSCNPGDPRIDPEFHPRNSYAPGAHNNQTRDKRNIRIPESKAPWTDNKHEKNAQVFFSESRGASQTDSENV